MERARRTHYGMAKDVVIEDAMQVASNNPGVGIDATVLFAGSKCCQMGTLLEVSGFAYVYFVSAHIEGRDALAEQDMRGECA